MTVLWHSHLTRNEIATTRPCEINQPKLRRPALLERFGFQKGKVYSTKCPPCHSSVHATGREKAERQSKQQKKHPRQRQYCSCLLSLMFSSKGSIMKSFTGPLLVVTHLVNSSAGGWLISHGGVGSNINLWSRKFFGSTSYWEHFDWNNYLTGILAPRTTILAARNFVFIAQIWTP